MADVAVTPDTGIGHFAAALGTPHVWIGTMGDPIEWSSHKTYRAPHPLANRQHKEGGGIFRPLWATSNDQYHITTPDGNRYGASDVPVEQVFNAFKRAMSSEAAPPEPDIETNPAPQPEPPAGEPITVHLEFKKDAGAGVGNLEANGFEARISNNSKEQDAIAVSGDEKVFVVADGLGRAGAPYRHGQVSIWSRAIAEAIARQKNISSLLEGQNLRRLAQQIKNDLEKEGVKFETTSRLGGSTVGVKTTVSAAERIGENTFSIIAIGDSPIYVIDGVSGAVIKKYGEDAMTGTTDNPIRNTVGMNRKGEIIKLNDKNKEYIVNTTVDLEPGQLLVLGSDFFSDQTYAGGKLLEFIKTDPNSFHEKATAPGTAKTDDASLIVIDPYKLPWEEKVPMPAVKAAVTV